jgi:hypothetical protein
MTEVVVLSLILMLQSVTSPPKAVHVRRVRLPVAARPMNLPADCGVGARCESDPATAFRILPDATVPVEGKQMVLRGPSNCGVTGMPVCPSKGREMVRANLGN